jgi:cAMP-specific phosphodiesterase 4
MIPPKTFVTFMMTLEDNYLKDNPFHNSTHAADVTQSTNVLLNSPALDVSISTNIRVCIIYIYMLNNNLIVKDDKIKNIRSCAQK